MTFWMTTVSWLSICFLPVRWKWSIWRFQTFWRGSDSFGSLELFCFRDFPRFLELFELFELCKKSLKIFSAFLNFFRIPARCTSDEWKRYLQVQAEEKPYDWDTENLYKIEIFKTVKTMLVTDVGDEMCLGPILRC